MIPSEAHVAAMAEALYDACYRAAEVSDRPFSKLGDRQQDQLRKQAMVALDTLARITTMTLAPDLAAAHGTRRGFR